MDRDEELEDLLRLNTQRPDVFPKLFVMVGNPTEPESTFRVLPPGATFFMEDICGPSWVAPRSEVHRGQIRVQIEVEHRAMGN